MNHKDQQLFRAVLPPAFAIGFLLAVGLAVAFGLPWDVSGIGAG